MNTDVELVTVSHIDDVCTITLNSPNNRNALSSALVSQLTQALQTVRQGSTRVVVLTHTGTVFCAGADVKESAGGASLPVRVVPELLSALWELPVPVIAKIGGAARGGGLGLIAAADIAICARGATFAFSEVRIGVVAATISPPVLARITPRAASDLMLTGKAFDSDHAQQIGLVTRTVDQLDLDETVNDLVAHIKRCEPNAVAATKKLLRASVQDFSDQVVQLAELSARYFQSPEAAEGMAALREKRRPSWDR